MKCVAVEASVSADRLWWNLPLCVGISSFSGALAIVNPILMPYWRQHDMSMSDIWILQGVFAVVLALCQIPSGYWADSVSRKRALLVGTLLAAVGDLLYAQATTFFDFLFAEILLGIGLACWAGADSAVIYDTLLYRGETSKNAYWSGLATAGMFIITAFAALASGYVFELHNQLPFVISGGFSLLQLVFVSLIQEPSRDRSSQMLSIKELPDVFVHCINDTLGVRWIMLAWCFLGTATQLAVWFYPVYFEATGWNEKDQGKIFALYAITAGMSSACAGKFKGRSELLYPIFVGLAACAISGHLLLGLVTTGWGVLFGVLHQICRGIVPVVFGTALHDRTPSSMRTTVLSIQGALATGAYGICTMRLGWAADSIGFQLVLILVGMCLTAMASVIWAKRPGDAEMCEQSYWESRRATEATSAS